MFYVLIQSIQADRKKELKSVSKSSQKYENGNSDTKENRSQPIDKLLDKERTFLSI